MGGQLGAVKPRPQRTAPGPDPCGTIPVAVLSRRTAWDAPASALARALDAARSERRELLDLAEWNPTRCGLGWDPKELVDLLSDLRLARHDPALGGTADARAAVS